MISLPDLNPDTLVSLITSLFSSLQRVSTYLQERRLQGIYEVLSQIRTVTLCDPRGEVTTVDTVQRVRFLQNHVPVLLDYIWGDGEILGEYRSTPGVPVDVYKEGSRQVVVISLRELRNFGDRLTFRTHRKVSQGFTAREECWETEIYHRTHHIELRIAFPRERRCQGATVTVQSTARTVALGPENLHTRPNGSQELVWVCNNPRLNERYRLRWVW